MITRAPSRVPESVRMKVLAAVAGRMRFEDGATAVEYALMVALIAGVILGAVASLGSAITGSLTTCAEAVAAADGTGEC